MQDQTRTRLSHLSIFKIKKIRYCICSVSGVAKNAECRTHVACFALLRHQTWKNTPPQQTQLQNLFSSVTHVSFSHIPFTFNHFLRYYYYLLFYSFISCVLTLHYIHILILILLTSKLGFFWHYKNTLNYSIWIYLLDSDLVQFSIV
jgi:hypothetical protein